MCRGYKLLSLCHDYKSSWYSVLSINHRNLFEFTKSVCFRKLMSLTKKTNPFEYLINRYKFFIYVYFFRSKEYVVKMFSFNAVKVHLYKQIGTVWKEKSFAGTLSTNCAFLKLVWKIKIMRSWRAILFNLRRYWVFLKKIVLF